MVKPTKKQSQVQQNKKDVLVALESSLGVVTTACKKVQIDRTTFYRYVNDDAVFAKAVKDIENVAIDFAESSLHKQIQAGVPASTIFYLKTKGKERGYIERSEITGKDGGPVEVSTRVIEPGE
jgi:predicted DNA-binding transcriptional regulator AlpA